MAGLRYIFLLIALVCVFATPARAQPTLQDTTCMPDILTIIEANGLLEAEREIIQNQNLIAKPDSILEYSCFEQHMTLSGEETGQMFTENETFFGIDDAFVDQYTLDRGIYSIVFAGLIEYLRENFWHRYLGDRADLQGLPTDGTGFTCYAMGYVWNKAKCMNFIIPRNAQDGFYTFAEYRDMTDPRNLPDPQMCDTWPEWADEITDSQRMSAPSTTPAGSGYYIEDELVVYPEMFDPAECGDAPPVRTGIYVPPFQVAGQDGYDEYMCTAPGCYYNGSTCTR